MKFIHYDSTVPEAAALSCESIDEVKQLIEHGTLQLYFEREDLILCADTINPNSSSLATFTADPVGRVPLQNVVAYSVREIIEGSLEEESAIRAKLFAMAGLLRETAQYIEQQAKEISDSGWDDSGAATFRGAEDIWAESVNEAINDGEAK